MEKKPIEQGIVARAVAGLSNAKTRISALFSPLEPLKTITSPEQEKLIAGRQFDFNVGFNTVTTPRSNEGVTFNQLRGLADAYDLVRVAIDTRKDQVAKLRWKCQPRDEKAERDGRYDAIEEFFMSPNKEHDWHDWLRMLIEEVLVTDAPTIYPRFANDGSLYSFDLVDGATIARKLDMTGHTPLPPDVAYQQVIKGVPVADFTREELVYKPRNPRVNKVYGYSPVEQIITTINIAIRRQINQLQYYTEGSTPDLIMSVPATWSPKQTKEFSDWWNGILRGNTSARRGTMFVPDGAKPIDTKEKALKDDYDDWLARIICYAFSISPQALIKQMNRATAETADKESDDEGLQPLMIWIKSLIDLLITKYFNAPDIELAWVSEEKVNAKVQADIFAIYIANKVITPDEVRIDIGREPMTPEEREKAFPTPIEPKLDANGEPVGDLKSDGKANPSAEKDKKPDGEPVEKAAIKRIDRERDLVKVAREDMGQTIKKLLGVAMKRVATQIAELITKGGDEERIQAILDAIDLSDLDDMGEKSLPAIESIARDGVIVAAAQLGIDDVDIVAQANDEAIVWAKDRAAELVGKRWVDGALVDNPDAVWQITQSTREMLRGTITDLVTGGKSNQGIASAIKEAYAFSVDRAIMIARTETAIADVQGNMALYRKSGLVSGKKWLISDGEGCPICLELQAQGEVGIDKAFAGGYDSPPAHPNCECDIIPVLIKGA